MKTVKFISKESYFKISRNKDTYDKLKNQSELVIDDSHKGY